MCARLDVRDATFSYDGKNNIFERITFSVDPGDIFCLLGPNGTGKSTLLRCICNLHRLNEGSITLDGQDVRKVSPAGLARKLGYIPQVHIPAFPYTVLQLVLLGRTPHLNLIASPSENDYRIAEAALKTVGLEQLRDRPYTELSGGQMQLVLIARVLAQEPEVLLLDEPTSHLDMGNQIHTIRLIKKLSERGLSIVMTSHVPDIAIMASAKVGVLKDRRLVATGLADDVITEKNLADTYGVNTKIVYLDGDIGRKIVVPLIKL